MGFFTPGLDSNGLGDVAFLEGGRAAGRQGGANWVGFGAYAFSIVAGWRPGGTAESATGAYSYY